MATSRLDDRSLMPLFNLACREGQIFDILEFKRKKNLVIFFVSFPDAAFLLKAEEAYARLKEQNAEMSVVCSLPLTEIESFYRKNRLSYCILSDEKREVFAKFLSFEKGEDIAALFITDRFGEIFFQYAAKVVSDMPSFDDIVKSLVFIESQCPECGGGL